MSRSQRGAIAIGLRPRQDPRMGGREDPGAMKTNPSIRRRYWIAFAALLLGAGYSLCAAAAFAWLTITPVKDGYFEFHERRFILWSLAFLCCAAGVAFCIARLAMLRRAK